MIKYFYPQTYMWDINKVPGDNIPATLANLNRLVAEINAMSTPSGTATSGDIPITLSNYITNGMDLDTTDHDNSIIYSRVGDIVTFTIHLATIYNNGGNSPSGGTLLMPVFEKTTISKLNQVVRELGGNPPQITQPNGQHIYIEYPRSDRPGATYFITGQYKLI